MAPARRPGQPSVGIQVAGLTSAVRRSSSGRTSQSHRGARCNGGPSRVADLMALRHDPARPTPDASSAATPRGAEVGTPPGEGVHRISLRERIPPSWPRGAPPGPRRPGATLDRLKLSGGLDPPARRTTWKGAGQMRVASKRSRTTISSYAAELVADTAGTDPATCPGRSPSSRTSPPFWLRCATSRWSTSGSRGWPPDTPRSGEPAAPSRLRTERDAEARRAGDRVTAGLPSTGLACATGPTNWSASPASDPPPPATAAAAAPTARRRRAAAKKRREASDLMLRGVDRRTRRSPRPAPAPARPALLDHSGRAESAPRSRRRAKARRRNVDALPDGCAPPWHPPRDASASGCPPCSGRTVTARQWSSASPAGELAHESTFARAPTSTSAVLRARPRRLGSAPRRSPPPTASCRSLGARRKRRKKPKKGRKWAARRVAKPGNPVDAGARS